MVVLLECPITAGQIACQITDTGDSEAGHENREQPSQVTYQPGQTKSWEYLWPSS